MTFAAIALLQGCLTTDYVIPRKTELNARLEVPREYGPVLLHHPWLSSTTTVMGNAPGAAWAIAHHTAGHDESLRPFEAHWTAARLLEGGTAPEDLPPPPLPAQGLALDQLIRGVDAAEGALGAAWQDDPSTEGVDPFLLAWSDEREGWDRYPLAGLDLTEGRFQVGHGSALAGLQTDEVHLLLPEEAPRPLPLAELVGTPHFWTGATDTERIRLVYAPRAEEVCSGVASVDPLAWETPPGCLALPIPHGGVRDGVVGGTVDEALFVLRAEPLLVARSGAPEVLGRVLLGTTNGAHVQRHQNLPGALRARFTTADVDYDEVLTAEGTHDRYLRERYIGFTCACDRQDEMKTCPCVARPEPVELTVNHMVRPGRALAVFSDRIDLSARTHALFFDVGRLESTPLGTWDPAFAPEFPPYPEDEAPPDAPFDLSLAPVNGQGEPCAVSLHSTTATVPPTGTTYTIDPAEPYVLLVDCPASDGHAPYLGGQWSVLGADLPAVAASLTEPLLARGVPLNALHDPIEVLALPGVPGFAALRTNGPAWISADDQGHREDPLGGAPRFLSDGRMVFDGGDAWDPFTRQATPGFPGLFTATTLNEDAARGVAWVMQAGWLRIWPRGGGSALLESFGQHVDLVATSSDGARRLVRSATGPLEIHTTEGAFTLPNNVDCSHGWLAEGTDEVFGLCSSGPWRWHPELVDGWVEWQSTSLGAAHGDWGRFDAAGRSLLFSTPDGVQRYEDGLPLVDLGEPVDTLACGDRACIGLQSAPVARVVRFGLDEPLTEVRAVAADEVTTGVDDGLWFHLPGDGWYEAEQPTQRRTGEPGVGPFPLVRDDGATLLEVRPFGPAPQPLGVAPAGLSPVDFQAVAVAIAPPGAVVHDLHARPELVEAPCLVVRVDPPGDEPPLWVCTW